MCPHDRTTAGCIAPATKKLGGSKPASIQSRSPVSSGSTPASIRDGLSPSRRRRVPLLIELQNPTLCPLNSQTRAWRPPNMLNDMTKCDNLFHTGIGTAFADIKIDGHRETWPIRSKGFGAGCGAAITRRPGMLRARRRFAQRLIYSRRGAARQPCGPPAHSRARTQQTAGPRSRG
jgi:hypothetical protein